MERITNRDLERVLVRFARAYGAHVAESYNDIGGLLIYSAYGGVSVRQVMSDGGGQTEVGNIGLCTKRELYNALAFGARVLEDAKERGVQ